MKVEHADITDIDSLTELRLAYLKEDYDNLSEGDIKKIKQALPDYFKKNLNHNIFCYMIKENEEIIEKPMSPAFITDRTGTVLNVYTAPSYRHQGCAKMIMNQLLSDAVKKKSECC